MTHDCNSMFYIFNGLLNSNILCSLDYFFFCWRIKNGWILYTSWFINFLSFFIYITWFGFSIKVENEKNEGKDIKINPYDNLPFHRKLIDKKNNKVEIFDLKSYSYNWYDFTSYICLDKCGLNKLSINT